MLRQIGVMGRKKLTRVMLRAKAFFRTYRPQNGLELDPQHLSSCEDDVAVLVLVPALMMPRLVWHALGLDVSASIANILREHDGQLLTLGAYTCELELDIARQVALAPTNARTDQPACGTGTP